MQSEEKERIILVYIGERYNSQKGKTTPIWLTVTREQFDNGTVPTRDESSGHYRCYTGKGSKCIKMCVGAAYEIDQTKGGTAIYYGSERFIGMWPDQEMRRAWRIESESYESTAEAEKRAGKVRDEDYDGLYAWRLAYNNAVGYTRKTAVLALAINYITRGVRE